MTARPHNLFVCAGLSVLFSTFAGCGRPDSAGTASIRFTVSVNDQFKFDPAQFACRPNQAVVIRVSNTLPSHGPDIAHNLVVLESSVNADAFGQAVLNAPADNNYIPAQFLSGILARTPLVHPGETADLVFTAPALPGSYPMLCSFPGHCILGMRANLIVR